ncbi:glycosyltransferase family 4 protein [Longibaculum muris]|uniref:glycosyltransferase family 4 protein n=1 Tax=Longibaculum muris TaxID=1796628 RepID=UPI0022E5A263|nr:glycosyltransferase family 4 protein [Longibaculum muris]
MKNVLFVNSSIYLPGEGGYKRTLYLLDMMLEMGYKCTLLTGDFNHYSKKSRDINKFRNNYPEYNKSIEILHKIPYKKNVSFKRFYSDKMFESNIAKWVKHHIKEYDVVFVSDQEAVIKISRILKNETATLIIDIRDLFPEALKVVFKNELLYKFLTYPFKIHEDKSFACADELVAVSKEYLERGLLTNKKSQNPEVVYIGATLELFDEGINSYSNKIVKQDNEFWITYAGTIGASYDFKTIIDAMSILEKQHSNIKFKILGQGPDEKMLKEYCKEIGTFNVDFLGFKNYPEMAAYLSKSDITINNIKKNASQSIINKVADYFASGKPMLNSCRNKEMQWLINNFKTGLNYEAENVQDFIDKFYVLYNDKSLCSKFGKNARQLAESQFDRKTSYKKIINVIEKTKK